MSEIDAWEAELAALESAAADALLEVERTHQRLCKLETETEMARVAAHEAIGRAERAQKQVERMLAQSGRNWWER